MSSSLPDAFWHEIRERCNRLPVWLPGTPMALGDVGAFPSHNWTKFTTLENLTIEAKPDTVGVEGDIEYASSDGVTQSVGLTRSGVTTVAVEAQGDVSYTFTRKGAFVLRTRDATVHRLADLDAVERRVLDLHQQGKWQPDWVVVTEVLVGGPSLVLVSAGRTGEATVRLRGQAAIDPTTAVALRPSFTVESRQGLAASFASTAPTPLMWRGYRVHDPLFRKAKFSEQRGTEKSEKGPAPAYTSPSAYWAEIEYPEDLETESAGPAV
ncbi:hypothetical protein ABZ079_23560 [Streptomyces sp. NPDC006314]|uniref:hypothetical protein n=1 Tax=Streptomyces sp. NPDC006314 TaxID=3154475 RepID=UPI0033A23279